MHIGETQATLSEKKHDKYIFAETIVTKIVCMACITFILYTCYIADKKAQHPKRKAGIYVERQLWQTQFGENFPGGELTKHLKSHFQKGRHTFVYREKFNHNNATRKYFG